jgi:GDP-L-fucose synthase
MYNTNDKVCVLGSTGMVGSAIVRRLKEIGYTNILTPTRKKLDLKDSDAVYTYFKRKKPKICYMAAATVGGILANMSQPATFLYDNSMMALNTICGAYNNLVQQFLYLGSSCIYPRDCVQPIKEEYLLAGPLENTNEAYAIAKITGIKLCQSLDGDFLNSSYKTLMPCNLYGPGDNFNLENSHLIPALIKKIHYAKINNQDWVEIWGTGTPRREFMYVEDFAEICVLLQNELCDRDHRNINLINVGTGIDYEIVEIAQMIADIIGYTGLFSYDESKPDGTPRKLLDISLLERFNWKPKTDLREGIEKTYKWYLENVYEN